MNIDNFKEMTHEDFQQLTIKLMDTLIIETHNKKFKIENLINCFLAFVAGIFHKVSESKENYSKCISIMVKELNWSIEKYEICKIMAEKQNNSSH